MKCFAPWMAVATTTLLALLFPASTLAQGSVLDKFKRYPSCDLCGAVDAFVTKEGVFLPEGTGGVLPEGLTCDEAEKMAAEGSLSEASCLMLGLRVARKCGCKSGDRGDSGDAPVTSPSVPAPSGGGSNPTRPSAPSSGSGGGPSPPAPSSSSGGGSNPSAPSPSGGAGGASNPIADSTPVTGTIVVTLGNLTEIPDTELPALERACAAFLDERLAAISDVECMASVEGPRIGVGIAVEFIIMAMSTTPDETSETFTTLANQQFATGGADFLTLLRAESAFFNTTTTATSPTTASPPTDDDGLSGTALGFLIGLGIVAFLGVLIGAYCLLKDRPKPQPLNLTSSGLSVDVISDPPPRKKPSAMLYPPSFGPKPKVVPVAAAASVAAAAANSDDPEIQKAGSLLIDDNASITDQSMTDGSTISSLRPDMQSRVIQAPSGKLGIVIDTTLDGPVIHRVNENSPLKGYIFPGDIIVAVNNIDTRAMSAQAITSLMARTSQRRRMLTVLSADVISAEGAALRPSSGDSVATEEQDEEETKQEIEPAMVPPMLLPVAGSSSAMTGLVAGVGAAATGLAAAIVAAASSKPTAAAAAEQRDAVQDVEPAEVVVVPPVAVATSAASVAGASEKVSVHSDDDIASVASSLRSEMQPRIVKAPPGKLGIVIDTTQDGPMVNEVKEGSLLKGLLHEGDIIAKVNDVDTRAMSGAAITSLMVRTAKQTRLLTVLGKDFEK